jgi:hypothetical protein
LQLGHEGMGDAPVLSHCSLLRNLWPKPTGVLEHCREEETYCWFSTCRGVSFRPHSLVNIHFPNNSQFHLHAWTHNWQCPDSQKFL